MVHKIGRKHAAKLRVIALLAGFVVPVAICLAAGAGFLPHGAMFVAAICMIAGLFVERWLFFAEATHSVSLYYDESR